MLFYMYVAVKMADAVSLTSSDSNDSGQSSTLPTQAPIPPSSSSSTMFEDCSAELVPCKSPPLVASIDLELLRKDDRILELVSYPVVRQSPEKSLLDIDAESAADAANNGIDNSAECTLSLIHI